MEWRIWVTWWFIFCIRYSKWFWIYILKKHDEKNTDDPSIRIYAKKYKNRITFNIKTGYHVDLLTPETMKLLRSTKSKITKKENGVNVRHLKITEVVLVHCNIVNNNYQEISGVLYTYITNR